MKKMLAIILVVLMLISLVSCSSTGETTSDTSLIDGVVVSSPQLKEPYTPETLESQETISSQTPQEDNFTSTIAKPDEVKFYKNGKYGSSKNSNKNYEIAKLVESWYKSYESDTLPFCNWEHNAETIAEIKQKETVIEICYKDYTQIKMLNKIDHGKQRKIMIPLTGRYAYGVFLGKEEYNYTILLGELGDGGLEKYFKGITLDKDVRKWESTVIAPTKVTFYKDGMQSVSTESDLNRKIAKYIESWFKYATEFTSMPAIITDSNITQQKYTTTAIELEFDSSFTFYGGSIQKNTRKIFITLDGEHPYHIFTNDGLHDTSWGNMSPVTRNYNRNLEPFFEGRKFEEIQPPDRWTSTVYPPSRIQLYKNGELLEEFADREFNHNVAKQIESWYLYEEEIDIESTGIKNTTIDDIRKNETYIEVFFNSEIKFYGKYLSIKDDCCLLIPISGDFAYCIFVAGADNDYNKYTFPEKVTNLEPFFDTLK